MCVFLCFSIAIKSYVIYDHLTYKKNMGADLREDDQFLRDYPGACTISTQQVHACENHLFIFNIIICSGLCLSVVACSFHFHDTYCIGWRSEEANWCGCLYRVQLKDTAGVSLIFWFIYIYIERERNGPLIY